jgi:hypothetical protein
MSALTISFWSVLGIGTALLLLCLFETEKYRDKIGIAALILGVIAGVALTLSALILMDGWSARMEHFDFAAFAPTMNVGYKSDGRGMMFAIYFWPYEAVSDACFILAAKHGGVTDRDRQIIAEHSDRTQCRKKRRVVPEPTHRFNGGPSVNVVDARLRLSAQRALLGAITPRIRLIKVRMNDLEILFTVIADSTLSDGARDALSIAATEILADFPDHAIREDIIIDAGPLPKEDLLAHGWVYLRAEGE